MSRELDTSAAQMLRHGRNVLSTLCLMVELVFGRVMPTLALEQVLLQLKWKHQFQFAGYYAAVEKGFYRDNGLDVAVREGGPGMMRASRWPRALPTSACPRPVFSSTATNAPTMSSSA